ncbi:MAG: general secretion pathway protein GspB [Gammaproteobacteria bacterium]|nr:general secretion pathway protein GspB [Gammaproteobacteria bacterium]NNF67659.1 general secretion pathway protein GspB [Gammaproteobacteria bacterium]
MSFILDALQRAESLRGSRSAALPADSTLGEIAQPANSRRPAGLALLLACGAFVALFVLSFFFWPGNDSREITPVAGTAVRAVPSFSVVTPETRLADVARSNDREIRSLNREVARASPAPQTTASGSVTISSENLSADEPAGTIKPGTVTVSNAPLSATAEPARVLTNITGESLPGYQELVLSRRVQMPEFHLDIHVYAPLPERRFVFVNNRKYREGDQLDEGGTVERITPVGAILNHKGYRFELVPD